MYNLYAIVAMGADRSIGFNGDMPWHISADLKNFKALTSGHPVIMGRRTWLSLPRRPLPGRHNIVISRNPDFSAEGADVAPSLGEALALCRDGEVPFIIGGGMLYKEALPLCSKLFITRVEAEFPHADTFFPPIDPSEWRLADCSGTFTDPSGLKFRFETYESCSDK